MRAFALAPTLLGLGLTGCTQAATNDPALGSLMRIQAAQYVAGTTPAAAGGPEVEAIELLTNTIWPGYADKPVRGAVGASATSATLALVGDHGYWIVSAGVPDVSAPEYPTFRATAAFSTALEAGSYALEVRAVDAAGHFGPPSTAPLSALPGAPAESSMGALVVGLSWDTEADLDLHVVDPLGNEIFHGAPSSSDDSGPDASAADGGVLDVDSNAQCVIDGLRRENVIWANEPPSGHYFVRVDTASLCGETEAHWKVQVSHDGSALGGATGIALESDTRDAHDRGAGVLAFEFDVP
jgi:hypothetical protein